MKRNVQVSACIRYINNEFSNYIKKLGQMTQILLKKNGDEIKTNFAPEDFIWYADNWIWGSIKIPKNCHPIDYTLAMSWSAGQYNVLVELTPHLPWFKNFVFGGHFGFF